MKTEGVKQFIIELDRLSSIPCQQYLQHFVDGKADVLKLFRELGEKYAWLYANSDYDLIKFEIENNLFNWELHSLHLVKYRPELFNPHQYNWKDYGWAVAKYCPQFFNADKFNWEKHSRYVAVYCPEHFDPIRFNWEKYSYIVAMYCPQYIETDKYNWQAHEWAVREYCPEKLVLKKQP